MLRTDWRETVDEIERGLQQCLASLDRYESQFHTVLAEPTPVVEPTRFVPPKSDGFADKLATAGERVASVERLLDEQKQLWQQFHDAVREARQSRPVS